MDLFHDRKFLVKTLSVVYRMMVASAPLLEFAIPRSEGELRRYYLEHLMEEEGHDAMLLDDLHRLGVENVPYSRLAAEMTGAQYYLIAHEHPALLLGYMYALERESMAVDVVDELSQHHGTQLTALRHHSIHDPAHRRDLARLIAKQPESLQARIKSNEQYTLFRLEEALK